MKIRQRQIHISAALLGFLFFASWMLKSGHFLLADHIHEDKPACDAEHTGKSKHLHDARYSNEDCAVCSFLLAVPELVSVSSSLHAPKPVANKNIQAPVVPFQSGAKDSVRLRGPPPTDT